METKEELDKIIKYKQQLIDNFQFLSTSLPNLTDNLSDSIHKNRITNVLTYTKYEYHSALREKFDSRFNLSLVDLKTLALLQRKLVNPYEYRDSCQKFEESFVPGKESFQLNPEIFNICKPYLNTPEICRISLK